MQACGAGGTTQDVAVEIQGDLRDRVRDLLLKKGYGVKG
jgi:translation initiation factor 1 (eIF-1/SUI1)